MAAATERTHARGAAPARLLGVVLAACAVSSAWAGDWRITPRAGLNGVVSDNITLAPRGNEKSEFVIDATAGVDVQGVGRRVTTDFFYTAQGLFYTAGIGKNDLIHHFQGDTNVELVEDWLFLDIDANLRQQVIDSNGRRTSDNINVTANREYVFTAGVSPYLKHRFGSFADATVRAGAATVVNSDSGFDSNIGRFTLDLESGKRFDRAPWHYHIEYRTSNQNSGSSAAQNFAKTWLDMRYRLNSRIQPLVRVGYEQNDYVTTRPETDGFIWRLGGQWTPNARTLVEVGAQHRFYGLGPFLDLRYRHRRVVLTAHYDDDITTVNEERASARQVTLTDPFGDPIDPDTGSLLQISPEGSDSTFQTIIQRRFRGSFAFNGRRSTARLSGYAQVREFEVSGGDESVYGLNLLLSRNFNAQLALQVTGGWQYFDRASGTDRRDRFNLGVALNRRFNRTLSGSVQLRRVTQNANIDFNNYDENRVSATLNKTF